MILRGSLWGKPAFMAVYRRQEIVPSQPDRISQKRFKILTETVLV